MNFPIHSTDPRHSLAPHSETWTRPKPQIERLIVRALQQTPIALSHFLGRNPAIESPASVEADDLKRSAGIGHEAAPFLKSIASHLDSDLPGSKIARADLTAERERCGAQAPPRGQIFRPHYCAMTADAVRCLPTSEVETILHQWAEQYNDRLQNEREGDHMQISSPCSTKLEGATVRA